MPRSPPEKGRETLSLHRTEIIGRLTADPENRMVGENMVTNFNVAVDPDYQPRSGEEKAATFYRVAVWGKQADACAKYLHKGDPVYCDGEPSVRTYQGRDGTMKFSLELRAGKVQFLSSKKDAQTPAVPAPAQPYGYAPPAPAPAYAPAQPAPAYNNYAVQPHVAPVSAPANRFNEDDLPF